MGCNNGCDDGCQCDSLAGTSAYVYFAQADDANGTNFNVLGNNTVPTQAYLGILSTSFEGTPTFNTPGTWTWISILSLPVSYADGGNTPTAFGGITITLGSVVVPAGTYLVSASMYLVNASTAASYITIFISDTENGTNANSIRLADLGNGSHLTVATNTSKIVVTGTATITFKATGQAVGSFTPTAEVYEMNVIQVHP